MINLNSGDFKVEMKLLLLFIILFSLFLLDRRLDYERMEQYYNYFRSLAHGHTSSRIFRQYP
jgi:hypothetical protein